MRISNLIQPGMPDFEERKRSQQRKEMGEAYKKTAKFVEVSKNPMLAVLENLMSGKTEKDLLASDVQSSNEQLSFDEAINQKVETQINTKAKDIEQKRSLAVENLNTSTTDNKHYIDSGEVGTSPDETIQLLEQAKQASLAPTQPSEQDLRIAASATAQIQQTEAVLRGETVDASEEQELVVAEDLVVDIPDRFMNDFKRDVNTPTIFGKELESLLFQRTFNKLVETYSNHIAMVNNGYRSINEPSFSKIA